jgi:ubiquinol-cytochrome c reductase subunit 7
MAAKQATGLVKMLDPLLGRMAAWYQRSVGTELRKYGLRYEDLLDPQLDLDVNEAMRRLPQEEQDLRIQRLKRAVDCSLKKQYLAKDIQAVQTPYNFYLDPLVAEVKAEMAERALLGTGKPYDRSIP